MQTPTLYEAGRIECTNKNGHVASMNTYNEMRFVKEVIFPNVDIDMWIGTYHEDNDYIWDDNTG